MVVVVTVLMTVNLDGNLFKPPVSLTCRWPNAFVLHSICSTAEAACTNAIS